MNATSDLALVTGARRGIGLAVAHRLATGGMRLILADLDERQVQDAASTLPGAGHIAIQMDVSSEASVANVFLAVESHHGPIRALIANAGVLIFNQDGEHSAISDLEVGAWEQTFAVNALGTFLCIKHFFKARKANRVTHARVVTMSSVSAQLGGYRASAAYIASKAAVIGLTKAAAREGAELGITANTVAPGLIDAPLMYQAMSKQMPPTNSYPEIPIGRLGDSREVAEAVAYLLSPGADYVTGSVLDVNGGYRMQ